MRFNTPLRYPGGKGKLLHLFKQIFARNNLYDCHYIEPFAGGAGLALSLLFLEHAIHIHINDLNQSIYAFWNSVLNETEDLCRMIQDTPVTMEEWYRQKTIQNNADEVSPLNLGFSTFFLNRTNHSGIIGGGVIGGKKQAGKWKLDARYNKSDLIWRIQRIALFRERISLYNLDAVKLIDEILPKIKANKSVVYLDPPYYVKGQGLYDNFYEHSDHVQLAEKIKRIANHYWIVSYDNVSPIRKLYGDMKHITYNLNYSAQNRYQGAEFMAFSNKFILPEDLYSEEPKISYIHNTKIFNF